MTIPQLLLIGTLAWAAGMPTAEGSLSVTLDFSGFGSGVWGNLRNDSWDGSTSDATKRSAAENVITTAADYWEAAFVSSTTNLSVTISVGWAALGGSSLAQGGASWQGSSTNYAFASNSLNFDGDGSSNFFVDLTPEENSEWTKTSERTADLGGGTVNVERVYYNANTSGAAFNNADMLSVAIHEIGHALGFLGAYPKYSALNQGGDGDLDLSDGTQVAYSGGHLSYSTTVPESPGFPANGYVIGGTYYPMAMGPSIVGGTRKLLTEVDILTLGDVHGFDNVNTNPVLVPEPGILGLLVSGLASALAFRHRLGPLTRGYSHFRREARRTRP